MSTTDDEADSLLPQETAVTTEPEATTEPYPPTHQLLVCSSIISLFLCTAVGILSFFSPSRFVVSSPLPTVFWILAISTLTSFIVLVCLISDAVESRELWLRWLRLAMLIPLLLYLLLALFYTILQEYYAAASSALGLIVAGIASVALQTLPTKPLVPTRFSIKIKGLVTYTICATWIFINVLLGCSMLHGATRVSIQWKYPPTGSYYSTPQATKVLFECQGTGSPTVILETGLGAYRKISFRDQFYKLSIKTRTCWYDRPGYGYSSPLISSDVQSISLVSNNLWSLLNAAGERGPYVLVGHSMGGLFVRDFTMDHFSNVSGIMLIDVMSEYQGRNPMWFRNLCLAVNAVSSLIPSVGALVALASDAMYKWKKEDVVHYMNDVWCKTAVSESLGSVGIVNEGGDGIREFIRKVESMPNGFGEIPMTVMTSGDSVNGTCSENGHGGHCSLISDLPVYGKIVTEDGTYVYFNNSVPVDTLNDTLGWHRDQAALSTDNLWEIYPTSNHFIMNDHEDRVLDRMKELVDRARIYWRNTVKS